jgi:HK97 family phage portal protein
MFFSKPKADSGDRSAFGDYWFSPVPARIGGNVSPEVAETLAAVYGCVKVHVDHVSTLPFQMYRLKSNGGKQQIRDHWVYRLFAKRPNDYQNPMQFMQMMHRHLELRGNAFAYIEEGSRGEVRALHPIHPDRVTVEILNDSVNAPNWRFRVKNRSGQDTPLARSELFHVKGMSSDGILGLNPIALARKMLSTGLSAQDYGVRYFDNDASPTSGILKHPTNFKDREQRELFRQTWQETQSGANRGKVAVLEYGVDYVPGTVISNADAQFIETKKFTRSEICTMFDVPPHMIGDLDRATFSNIEQQSIDYITKKLRQRLRCWEEAIKFDFLDPDDDEIGVRYDVLELTRGDSLARATYINTSIMNGTMTRNEGRIMEDREPSEDPRMDQPLQMVNMVTVDEAGNEPDGDDPASDGPAKDGKAAPEPAKPAPPPPGTPKNAERLNALAVAAAERVARKETQAILAALKEESWTEAISEAMTKHAAFVVQALGVSNQQAGAYIDARCRDPVHTGSEERDIYNAALARLTKLALEGTV